METHFNLSSTEWQELLRIQKNIHYLDELSCGIERGSHTACLETIEDEESGAKEFWVVNYFPGGPEGTVFIVKLEHDPYQFYLGKVREICEKRNLYFFHQSDPRGVSLWVSDRHIDESNYNTYGVPCI